MLNEAKACVVPGVLAYVGMRGAAAIAPSSQGWQVFGGILGAIAGIFVAKKI